MFDRAEHKKIFSDYCDSFRLKLVDEPEQLKVFSDALLFNVVEFVRDDFCGGSNADLESLMAAQDNLAHVANLLAFVLKKMVVVDDVKLKSLVTFDDSKNDSFPSF